MPVLGFVAQNQHDAFFSVSSTNGEQAKNGLGTCKTKQTVGKKKNPDALAGATGAKNLEDGLNRGDQSTLGMEQNATFDCDRFDRATRSIRFALSLNDADAWASLVTIFEARLTEDERAGIAYSAMRAMDEANAYRLASMTLFGVYAGEVLQ